MLVKIGSESLSDQGESVYTANRRSQVRFQHEAPVLHSQRKVKLREDHVSREKSCLFNFVLTTIVKIAFENLLE